MKKPELLSPAGNYEKMETAFHYGADAVYMGGELFNLRALADNFTNEQMSSAVLYAHSLGKKVYVTLNVIPHNREIDMMDEYIRFLEGLKVDGVIVSDLGVFDLVRSISDIPVSISTQASNTNWRSVKMFKEMGAKRVILAREVSLKEMAEIKQKVPDVELEAFIHGAMCISISGRCLISNYLAHRDANMGLCTHSCRWKYYLMEEKRPGEYLPVFEDDHGTYILNSKDLCTIEFFDKLLEVGLDSLKIEGRIKGVFYNAVVTKTYRQAIDMYFRGEYAYNPLWMEELRSVSNRQFTSGFYLNSPGSDSQNYTTTSYFYTHQFVAKVLEKISDTEYIIEIRNQVHQGEEVDLVRSIGDNLTFLMPPMKDAETGEEYETANTNQKVRIFKALEAVAGDMIRKKSVV
jgi:putative protease